VTFSFYSNIPFEKGPRTFTLTNLIGFSIIILVLIVVENSIQLPIQMMIGYSPFRLAVCASAVPIEMKIVCGFFPRRVISEIMKIHVMPVITIQMWKNHL